MANNGGASLGSLMISLKGDISGLQTSLRQATTELNKFNKNTLKNASKGMQGYGTVSGRLGDVLEGLRVKQKGISEDFRKAGISGVQFNRQFKEIAPGVYQGSLRIAEGGKKMGMGLQQGSQRGIVGMLSLKAMVGKIVHYITFSIGVQMVMAVRQGFTQMIEDFKNFERAATNAATVSGYLGRSFDDVRKKIQDISKELGKKTIFSATEVAKAFYNLASAGIDVAEVNEKELLPILNYAAATQSSLEDSTYAVLTAMKAFKLEMEDTQRIVDTFTGAITSSFFTMEKMQEFMKYTAPIAGELGLELEETVAAGMHLVNMGLEGSQAGQRLNMILTKLLKPTDKATRQLESMGLTLDDINPELYTMTEIFLKLNTAGFGAAEAATMFRARTAAAAASVISNVDAVSRYNTELLLSKGITEDVAEAQVSTLYGSFKLMQNALQEAGLEIAESLLPYLKQFAGFIKDVVAPEIVDFFKEFMKQLPLILSIVNALIKLKIAAFALSKIYALWRGLIIAVTAAKTAYAIITGKSNILALKEIILRKTKIGILIAETQATLGLVVATFALAAIVGAVALIALWPLINQVLGLVDTITTLNKETKKTHTILNTTFAGIEDYAHQFSILDLALWESKKTGKDFLESVKDIHKTFSDLEFPIDDFSDFISGIKDFKGERFNIYAELIETEFPDIDIDTSAVTKVASDLWAIYQKEFEGRGTTGERMLWQEEASIGFGQTDLASEIKAYKEVYGDLYDSAIVELKKWGQAFNATFDETIGAFGIFIDAGSDFEKQLGRILWGAAKGYREVTQEEIDTFNIMALIGVEVVEYREKLDNLIGSLEESRRIEAELNEVRENEADNLEKLSRLEVEYTIAKEEANKATMEFIQSVKDLITEIRKYSDSMNIVIGDLQDMITTSRELNSIKTDLADAYLSEEEAILKVAEAINIYGANSNKVRNEEARAAKATQRRIDLQEKEAEATTKLTLMRQKQQYVLEVGVELDINKDELQDLLYERDLLGGRSYYEGAIEAMFSAGELEKYIGGYTKAQQEAFIAGEENLSILIPLTEAEEKLFNISNKLITAQEELITKEGERALALAKQTALMNILENYTKLTNEKLKNYLENQIKIFEIEEKLYKLREGETDQFDKLFQKLAEQGLVNEETIDLYKEMKIAEGEVLSTNHDLMGVFGNLTDEQREFAENLINTTEGTDEYNKALSDLEGAGLTKEQIAIIVKYNKAEDRLTASVKEFGDTLGPVMDDLIDAGVLSPEIASAWGDIADNALEIAKNNIDLAIAQSKVDDGLIGLVTNTTNLAKALQDEENETFYDILSELIDKMKLGDAVGDDLLGVLNSFYEVDYSNIDDFSESQVIAALSMIEAADAAKLWEKGMKGTDVASDLYVSSLQAIVNASDIAWSDDNLESMYKINETLESLDETILSVGGSIDSLRETLEDFTAMASGMDPLVFSIRYTFPELMESELYVEDIKELFEDLEELDIPFSSALTRAWIGQDWSTFQSAIEKSPFGKQIVETLSEQDFDVDFDIKPAMSAENWKTLFDDYAEKANNIFSLYQSTIPIDDMFDKESFTDYVKNIKTQPQEIKDSFETVFSTWMATFNIEPTWGTDETKFEDFMDSLRADQLVVLLAMLQGAGLELPIDADLTEVYGAASKIDSLVLPEKILELIVETDLTDLQLLKSELESLFPGKKFGADVDIEVEEGFTMIRDIYGGDDDAELMKVAAEDINIAGETVSNMWDSSVLKFEGSWSDIMGTTRAVFDSSTGSLLGTFDTASGKWMGAVEASTTGAISMFDAASGVYIGSFDTTATNWKDNVQLSESLSKDIKVAGSREAGRVLGLEIDDSAKSFDEKVYDAGTDFHTEVTLAAGEISAAATDIKNAASGAGGGGSIWDLILPWQRGGIASKPTPGIFGEAGPEALIPLAGANKDRGLELLKTIIPKYFPELAMADGDIFGGDINGIEPGYKKITIPGFDRNTILERIHKTLIDIKNALTLKRFIPRMDTRDDRVETVDLIPIYVDIHKALADHYSKLTNEERKDVDISNIPSLTSALDEFQNRIHKITGQLVDIHTDIEDRIMVTFPEFPEELIPIDDIINRLPDYKKDKEIPSLLSSILVQLLSIKNIISSFNKIIPNYDIGFSPITKPIGIEPSIGGDTEPIDTSITENDLITAANTFLSAVQQAADSIINAMTVSTEKTQNTAESTSQEQVSAADEVVAASDALRDASSQLVNTITNTIRGNMEAWTAAMSKVIQDYSFMVNFGANRMMDAGIDFKNVTIEASHSFFRRIQEAGSHFSNVVSAGGYQRGAIVRQPTLGIFGEAGPEALVPLSGKNKKYGENILNEIIPRYYPQLMRQEGGIFGVSYMGGGSTTENYNESYNITGPITVTGVQNTRDFMNELKYRARSSKR